MLKEVQNLPHNWEKVSIPDVLFFQEGPGVRKWQFTQEGVKLLNGGNINNNAINLDSTKIYISEEEAQGKYSHFMIDPGDLVIACSGIVVNKFKYKIAVIDQKHTPLCLNTSTMRFKSLGDIDLKYYAYFLQTEYFSKQLQRLITGSAQLNFGPSHIKKMEVLLPPLEEQKKIATILDAADEYRQKTKALIDKYDQLTQSLFLDMFGDPVTNPMVWDLVSLGNLCGVGSSKRVFVDELVEEGIPFYRGTEVGKLAEGLMIKPKLFITSTHYEKLKKEKPVPKIGDLLMPSICPDGRIWIVNSNDPFYFKDGRVLWISIDSQKINSLYLRYHLKSAFQYNYENIASGTTFAELKIVALKKLFIFYPELKLQNQFAHRVAQIEQQKQQAEASLVKAEELFNSLLQRAFKGELAY